MRAAELCWLSYSLKFKCNFMEREKERELNNSQLCSIITTERGTVTREIKKSTSATRNHSSKNQLF